MEHSINNVRGQAKEKLVENMKQVRKRIAESITDIVTEKISVKQALGRIVATDMRALQDSPRHDESLRDGYVIGEVAEGREILELPIVSDIPAGIQAVSFLSTNSCCRIYTGGLIPKGGMRVIPFEVCSEQDGVLRLGAQALYAERKYIKRQGQDVRQGELLVAKGRRLTPDHLWLLSSTGTQEIEVALQPRVSCYCTGSELVHSSVDIIKGQKVSINSLLLQKQLPLYGATVCNSELIPDEFDELLGVFSQIRQDRVDLVVTTGGMGPGKYDLVEKAFQSSGGQVILRSLPMQPGKSILVGKLGPTMVLSLPGPPHAVHTLVNELVGPVLLMLQGVTDCWPQPIQAELEQDYFSRKDDILQAKNGILSIRGGKCFVRMAGRLESGGCYVMLPPGKHMFSAGEMVDVHLSAQFNQDLYF